MDAFNEEGITKSWQHDNLWAKAKDVENKSKMEFDNQLSYVFLRYLKLVGPGTWLL